MSKNFNEKKYLILGAIFAIGFFFLPVAVKAATTLYFDLEKPVIYVGDTFLINLEISTPDKLINVVDGTILYDNSRLEIKEVSTGNSLFALWPKPPVFSNDKGNLSFVGGISGGFQGEKGEVLKIIFLAKSEGEAQIDFLDGFSVFLNDGQGTQINPWMRTLSLNISKRPPEIPAKDEWQVLIEKDKTPPEPFEITLGKDPSIFDNRYFISFFTTDEESGVAYYEVQEGDKDSIRAESPYVLKDQNLKSYIYVKAIDKAGNERIVIVEPIYPMKWYENWWIWGIIILGLGVAYLVRRILWRKYKK